MVEKLVTTKGTQLCLCLLQSEESFKRFSINFETYRKMSSKSKSNELEKGERSHLKCLKVGLERTRVTSFYTNVLHSM